MDISVSRDGLSKKQLKFLNALEDYVLFGGARGGGKSHVTRIGATEDALKYPGRNILFVRPTIKSAREQFSTAQMSKILPREVTDPETGLTIPIWSFNAADSVYTFANGPDQNRPFDGGSRLVLGGITTLQDAQESYQGIEYVSIWFDELTKTDWEAVEYIIGSLRDTEYTPKFRAASNPGERGHKEVKAEFVTPYEKIKRKFSEKYSSDYSDKISWKKSVVDKKTGVSVETTYAYIPATLDDNPSENVRKNYLKVLLSLPEHLQKMYREGSWDTYEGKYWDNVDTDKIYIQLNDLAKYEIDFEWELKNMKTYLSMDWGYQDYTAIYWHLETSKGVIVTYHEEYMNKMLMEEVAQLVETTNERLGVQPKGIYTPWDIYTAKGSQFKTKGGVIIGEELIDVWRYYSKVLDIKASSDRKLGWANMTKAMKTEESYMIREGDGQKEMKAPAWMILKNECPNLIAEIDSMQIDPKNPEDIKKGMKDHGVDSVRMFWVAHIVDPKIKVALSEPIKGTGAWIRWNLEKEQKATKKRQSSVFNSGW